MAIYNGRLLIRKGKEADYDPDKLMAGEWALSTDKRIVRICVVPGVCIRMATYEAFEEDMAKIEEILETCQNIQEAVVRINAEVSANANAVAEYTANAKSYMESAKTSEINSKTSETNAKISETNAKSSETNAKVSEEKAQAVFESLPEDYNTLSKEFYEVAIKQNASGENIHVTDSANAKVREFALFGKAKQNTTLGNQLFHFKDGLNLSFSGVTMKDNGDGTLYVNGTSTKADGMTVLGNGFVGTEVVLSLKAGTYSVSGLPSGLMFYMYKANTASAESINITSNGSFTLEEDIDFTSISLRWQIDKTFNSPITKIMLNEGTEQLPWEPYTGGQPSPSPEYKQEIEVPNGNVVGKSCGNQLFDANSLDVNFNKTLEVTEDGYVITAKGGTNGPYAYSFYRFPVENFKGKTVYVKYNSFSANNSSGKAIVQIQVRRENSNDKYMVVSDKEIVITLMDDLTLFQLGIYTNNTGNILSEDNTVIIKGLTVSFVENTPWEPYKGTKATIPVTDFAGITVSSGGNYTDSNGQQWIANEIIKYADGSGERIQRMEYTKVTNFKSYHRNSDGTILRGNVSDNGKKTSNDKIGNVKCNIAIAKNANVQYTKNETSIAIETTGKVLLSIVGMDTQEKLNTFISENDVYVLYELETPIRTPLTAEEIAEIEKLSTFYPVTNISNDADCGMEVSYLADSKLYIDNKIAELATAMVNNI